jgi:hypothetical protein
MKNWIYSLSTHRLTHVSTSLAINYIKTSKKPNFNFGATSEGVSQNGWKNNKRCEKKKNHAN